MDLGTLPGEVVTSGASALAGMVLGYGFRNLVRRYDTNGVRLLLRDFTSDTTLVIPPRIISGAPTLPNVSFADLKALSNLYRAADRAGLHLNVRLRDSNQPADEYRKSTNLILICSPKSNAVTREALLKLDPVSVGLPTFDWDSESAERMVITNPDDASRPFRSPSFSEEARGETTLHDYALLLKAPNPWNDRLKMLVIAGIRGIGTWGMAEYLRKCPAGSGHHQRSERFASWRMGRRRTVGAVFRITYQDGDIDDDKTRCGLWPRA